MSPPEDPKTRFMRHVRKLRTGCWQWVGSKKRDRPGIGWFRLFGASRPPLMAQRAAWLLFRGPIPAGHIVYRTCTLGDCVAPEHLATGTRKDARRVAIERGTRSGVKLADEPRLLAALESGLTQAEIAADLGLSQNTVSRWAIERGLRRQPTKACWVRA